jgi:hypothetical protein
MDLGMDLGCWTNRWRMERDGMVGQKMKKASQALIELESSLTRKLSHPCNETNVKDRCWHLGTVKKQIYL